MHKKSSRHVTENMFPLHSYAFSEGLIHAENIGDDEEKVLNQRFVIRAFPWRYEGLEACPCPIVCCGPEGRRFFGTSSAHLRDLREAGRGEAPLLLESSKVTALMVVGADRLVQHRPTISRHAGVA